MRYLKCKCPHCSGHVEFPIEGRGQLIPCPHCESEFKLPWSIPNLRWIIGGAVVAAFILPIGIIFAFGTGKGADPKHDKIRAEMDAKMARVLAKMEAQQATNKARFEPEDHRVVAVSDWKYEGRYLTGYVTNRMNHTRDRLTVYFSIYDGDRAKIGTASDTVSGLGPGEVWKFKAAVWSEGARSATLDAVTCEYGRVY